MTRQTAAEPPERRLDDVAYIGSLDSQDQFGMVAGLARQVRAAYASAGDIITDGGGEVGGIAVAGMGGSAIGGDIVAAAYETSLSGQMATIRGYHLPEWVSSRSLVFAVSYSGNTEETVSCLSEALQRSCRIVCISTGGKIAEIAGGEELPLVKVPGSLQPRAASGYLSVPIAACLESLGLATDVEADVEETAGVLSLLSELYGPGVPSADNPAKQLAISLYGKVPVIYGAEVTSVAARRWKCQINENAKSLAFHNEFPELNHNEIVGWEHPPGLMDRFSVIYLLDELMHPQNRKRMEVTGALLKEYAGDIHEHHTSGRSRLARLFSSMYLGDYVSLYMAILEGIDPSPVVRIEELKRKLA
ncbi:MAG: bifunctional phosphoglucose/phosphomannose isomerase [Thermoleophilia bacterium]